MPRRLLLCPDCGSTDLDFEAGLITGQKYHCQACGYVGPFVVERDLDALEREAEEAERLGSGEP
jgi:hypothetical protein